MKKKFLVFTAALIISALLAGCQSEIDFNKDTINESTAIDRDVISKEAAMHVSAISQKLNTADVTYTSVALTNSANGITEYEVEFIYNGYKYFVDIDANTGEVNRVQKEPLPENEASNEANTDIGKDAAINAALEKAGIKGVKIEELVRLFVKADYDDGRFEYEIEFIFNGFEYEVTVDASDGKILDYSKEPTKEGKPEVDYSAPEYIGEDEAVAIALDHAKLTKAGIMGLKVALERDDGIMSYEVEFYFVDTEYDYEINAITGAIIGFDRDAEHVSLDKPSIIPDTNNFISKDDAKNVAILNANVNANDVFDFEIELDYDNGIAKYEIEFKVGNYEYEYDIDATNGSVLKHSKEYDD